MDAFDPIKLLAETKCQSVFGERKRAENALSRGIVPACIDGLRCAQPILRIKGLLF